MEEDVPSRHEDGEIPILDMIRRILNTSSRLDLNSAVAPVLTEYLARMMQTGYGKVYRKNTFETAIRIYDGN